MATNSNTGSISSSMASRGSGTSLSRQQCWWHPVLEPPCEMLGGKWAADEISLSLVAAHLLEEAEGGRVFDAFGDDPLPELVGKINAGLHDRAIPFAGAHFHDEGTVDLDFVDRQSAQVGERGIACTEVIDGKLKTHPAEPLEDVLRPVGLRHDD